MESKSELFTVAAASLLGVGAEQSRAELRFRIAACC